MKKQLILSSLAISVLFTPLSTVAGSINDRQENQLNRIEQGVKSGELTAKESKRLIKNQQHIAITEARFKADGQLTKKERATLNHKQNKASKRIFKQKHDKQKR